MIRPSKYGLRQYVAVFLWKNADGGSDCRSFFIEKLQTEEVTEREVFMRISLAEILHVVGQGVLIPCLIGLVTLMIVAVWQVGEIVVELFVERRKRKEDVPLLLTRIHKTGEKELDQLLADTNLTRKEKGTLKILLDAVGMPRASMVALAQRLLATQEDCYLKTVGITDMVAKLGPMLGLLGTLIPLGPGIVALGHGDTETLSHSLGLAFDTTIAGVLSAGVAVVISSIRKRWYNDYMVDLEAIMECILEEVVPDAA